MPRKKREPAVAKTAIELIDEAAADPNLTPKAAVLNLARMAMHLGVNHPEKLKTIGPALGNIASGIGKVAVAEAAKGGAGSEGLQELIKFFRDED